MPSTLHATAVTQQRQSPRSDDRTATDRRSADAARVSADGHLLNLQRLLPMWPAELADRTREGRRALLAKLRRALREERRRGLAGHWAYDLARHAALYRAYQDEIRLYQAPDGRNRGTARDCARR